jgi:hypothetical protein
MNEWKTYDNVECEFLAADLRSQVQPIDRGIGKNFKGFYRGYWTSNAETWKTDVCRTSRLRLKIRSVWMGKK